MVKTPPPKRGRLLTTSPLTPAGSLRALYGLYVYDAVPSHAFPPSRWGPLGTLSARHDRGARVAAENTVKNHKEQGSVSPVL